MHSCSWSRSCLGMYLQVQKGSDKLCLCTLCCCIRELWWGQGLLLCQLQLLSGRIESAMACGQQRVTVSSGDKHSRLSLGVAWVSVLRLALPIACNCFWAM